MAIGYSSNYYTTAKFEQRVEGMGGREHLDELEAQDHLQARRTMNPHFAANEEKIRQAKEQRETAEAYRLAERHLHDRVQLTGDEDSQLAQAKKLSLMARQRNALKSPHVAVRP